MNARPFDGPDRKPIGVRGSVRDVTEMKRASRALGEARALAARTTRELADARAQATRLSAHLGRSSDFQGLIGRHAKMRALYEKIELAASTDVAVHVHGASGSGKELVAHAVHNLSSRKDKAVRRDQLLRDPGDADREHVVRAREGAFTGAGSDAVGYPRPRRRRHAVSRRDRRHARSSLQAKLLRVLAGSAPSSLSVQTRLRITVDVRIIAATSARSGGDGGATGAIRKDLLFPHLECSADCPAAAEVSGPERPRRCWGRFCVEQISLDTGGQTA